MNTKSDLVLLEPGSLYFGRAPKVIQTLLGSCVALTAWHPTLLVGGMCHYLLPEKKASKKEHGPTYGIDALKVIEQHLKSYGHPDEFEFGLFGGSQMLCDEGLYAIGRDNINTANVWLKRNHLSVTHESLGGSMARRLKLDLQTGTIDLVSNSLQQDAR